MPPRPLPLPRSKLSVALAVTLPTLYLCLLVLFFVKPDTVRPFRVIRPHWFARSSEIDPVAKLLLNHDVAPRLLPFKFKLDLLQQLKEKEYINDNTFDQYKSEYLEKTKELFGENANPKTFDRVMNMIEPEKYLSINGDKGTISRLQGFFTFTNMIWFVSIMIFGVSLFNFIHIIIFPIVAVYKILKSIPEPVYEAFCYFASFQVILLADHWKGDEISVFVALTGYVFFWISFLITCNIHMDRLKKEVSSLYLDWVNLVILVILSLHFDSTLLGHMAVLSAEAVAGFRFVMMGLGYMIGFDSKEGLKVGTITSFLFMAGATFVHMSNKHMHPNWHPFHTACLRLGTFVYFLGLLILSSRFFPDKIYAKAQILMLVSALTATYMGMVFSISQLQSIAGTFFMMWLLEKYLEIPWDAKTFMTVGLMGLSAILYGFSMFIHQHPEFVLGLV